MRVLITGATSGIGRETARAFAAEGADLVLTGRRQDRLDALQGELSVEVTTSAFDVRDRSATTEALADIGSVDVLVNNAGLAVGTDPIQAGDHDDWDRMLDTNVRGILHVTRAVTPSMVEAGTGHIINIGSIAGHEVYPGGTVYCATKHAVKALTQGMRNDLLGTGVKVSTVDPGAVETEFSVVRMGGDQRAADAVYEGYEPLRPEDIARTVVWVATQPAHVQIAEVIVLPAAQASARNIHRVR